MAGLATGAEKHHSPRTLFTDTATSSEVARPSTVRGGRVLKSSPRSSRPHAGPDCRRRVSGNGRRKRSGILFTGTKMLCREETRFLVRGPKIETAYCVASPNADHLGMDVVVSAGRVQPHQGRHRLFTVPLFFGRDIDQTVTISCTSSPCPISTNRSKTYSKVARYQSASS